MPKKIAIEVDYRTEEMSETTLQCRAMGHAWQHVPLTVARRLELLQVGQTERIRICLRCEAEKTIRRDLPSYDVTYVNIKYKDPEGYLVPAGTGRMRRQEADKAMLAEEMRNYDLSALEISGELPE